MAIRRIVFRTACRLYESPGGRQIKAADTIRRNPLQPRSRPTRTLAEFDYRFEVDLSFLHILRDMPLMDMFYFIFPKNFN